MNTPPNIHLHTVLYSTIQYHKVLCSTVPYHIIPYYTIKYYKETSYPLRQLYSSDPTTPPTPPPPPIRNCCTLLALPISSEIMDGFWCSRCLNDRIEVPNMMRLFSGGATTPLVVKIWTKQPWVKIENLRIFDHNFSPLRGKIWLYLFYHFLGYGSKILHKKSEVILTKNEDVTVIFLNFDFILNWKNQCQALFLLKMTWIFLCKILEP